MQILLVDDNIETCALFKENFAMVGHQVVAAYSAGQALAFAEAVQYDAIIDDIMLPDLDGYSLACRLRRQSAFRSRPGSSHYRHTRSIAPTRMRSMLNSMRTCRSPLTWRSLKLRFRAVRRERPPGIRHSLLSCGAEDRRQVRVAILAPVLRAFGAQNDMVLHEVSDGK
jgi:CheY-like chemotaxis protein